MKGIHKRMPLPEDMKAPLGAAVMCYAMAEAAAKDCCEALKPGSKAWADGKTGGDIAKRLGNELRNLPQAMVFRAEAEAAAVEFARLVARRNDIAHALPRFVSGDTNTMHRRGTDWTVETMEDVADEFTVSCQTPAALYHDHLRGLRRV